MLDLGSLDLEEIASALADQTDYEHRAQATAGQASSTGLVRVVTHDGGLADVRPFGGLATSD